MLRMATTTAPDAKDVTEEFGQRWNRFWFTPADALPCSVLRIVVGLYFVKSLVTKMSVMLLGGVLPMPAVSGRWLEVMPKIVVVAVYEYTW